MIPKSDVTLVMQNDVNALAREIREAKGRIERNKNDAAIVAHNKELIDQKRRDIKCIIETASRLGIKLVDPGELK